MAEEEIGVYESGVGESNNVTMTSTADDRHDSPVDQETNGSDTLQQQPENMEQQHRQQNQNTPPTAVFVHGPPVLTVRDRVFHALFYRLALIYARAVPHQLRRVIEFALLFEALVSLALLTYVHYALTCHPVNCLSTKNLVMTGSREHDIVRDIIRDGIIRVEVIRGAAAGSNYSLLDSYRKEFSAELLYEDHEAVPTPGSKGDTRSSKSSDDLVVVSDSADQSSDDNAAIGVERSADNNYQQSDNSSTAAQRHNSSTTAGTIIDGHKLPWRHVVSFLFSSLRQFMLLLLQLFDTILLLDIDVRDDAPLASDVCIFEFALEFGFLRMSPKTRRRLNITTHLILLDPSDSQCFGGVFSQFLLAELLGYDDVILYSLKQLADDRPDKGYCRSVASGDHFKFVDMSISRLCYIPALFLMILFTMSISMLLRYSHHQIFIFIVDFLQVFDRTIFILFPLAPLMTALLALIGVEALISELFSDAATGFYVILIVWLADQYDVICCHMPLARRHWLRFFYVYHFLFYAYHYRFNGHYSSLALATSWLFIQHSMVYFFHHYELPAVEQQATVHNLIALAQRQPPTTTTDTTTTDTTTTPGQQQQQRRQRLLTVLTQTASGIVARTTADIGDFRHRVTTAATVPSASTTSMTTAMPTTTTTTTTTLQNQHLSSVMTQTADIGDFGCCVTTTALPVTTTTMPTATTSTTMLTSNATTTTTAATPTTIMPTTLGNQHLLSTMTQTEDIMSEFITTATTVTATLSANTDSSQQQQQQWSTMTDDAMPS